MNRLEKAIMNGLKNTLEDNIFLKGFEALHQWSRPEYLATVNIAKSLGKLHEYPGEKMIICLEESTKEFSDKCVPAAEYDLFEHYTPELQDTERNGKIDIALYKPNGHEALCVIEVKNFNPQPGPLILDLKRNLEYFTFENKSHTSIIKKTYVTYFKQFKDSKLITDVEKDLELAKNELINIVKANGISEDGVNFRVETFTVYDNLLYAGKYSEEEILNDTGDFFAEAGHFVGVIGVFEKD